MGGGGGGGGGAAQHQHLFDMCIFFLLLLLLFSIKPHPVGRIERTFPLTLKMTLKDLKRGTLTFEN